MENLPKMTTSIRKTLEKIYFIFVRPLIQYADVIWDNMSISLNKKIENVQLEASRKWF
jgi:hypothetical protein